MDIGESMDMNETASFFKKNNYLVIRNFISDDITNLLYNYCLVKVQRTDFQIFHDLKSYDPEWNGQFGDPQAPNVFNHYGDPLMDSLLSLSKLGIENFIDIKLDCNYSYWRLYQKHSDLKKHRDRESCEISVTLCLGYDVSDVDKSKYPDYKWPMFVETKDREDGLPIDLNPGDIIIYRGCRIEHWREPFIGLNHAQVFLHYNDTTGPYKINLDGRPILGIPKKYQRG